ncbi:DNA polymerase III subunit delta [Parasporobacterium paucivorans]|uniref:DNA polymerase III subunit delta n=1 Tax=Parasporobacterium paucivorans DSM 15970 TaxID=1122934 RepID=A0A1M6G777_9FIRM|nr:DNA polymerase III subunit delta [Parasporobacterium paucivorans]SHJ05815.1 DNA polymerase III, delta subunit [Parasporobacterium paucivorans DSM 15970]
MKILNQHIKNKEFANMYLLYGPEDYLKKKYRDKLTDAIIGSKDTMNYSRFAGEKMNLREIIDIAQTLPFFSERRLIVLENSGLFKKPDEEMLRFLDTLPETTCFIFVEEEADKRGRMYKKIKDKGYPCEMGIQTEKALSEWALGIISGENKKITYDTMQLFLSYTGSSMENISRELEKLLCYTLHKDIIAQEDVRSICTAEITGKIFEMVDAMGRKDKKKLFAHYQDLMAVKEPPLKILFMMERQFNILLQVKDLLRKGHGKSLIAEKMKLPPFIAAKTMSQADNFAYENLQKALEELLGAEELIKTGRTSDRIAIEMFFSEYC